MPLNWHDHISYDLYWPSLATSKNCNNSETFLQVTPSPVSHNSDINYKIIFFYNKGKLAN